MNVLWVSAYPVFGGPHNTILQIAEPLSSRGWESLVLLPDEPGSADERLRSAGIETVLLPPHRLRASWDPRVQLRTASAFRRSAAQIEELIAARRCKLVVLTGIDTTAAVAARRTGTAIVWQVLASRPPRPVREAWMVLVRRWADAVMFSGRKIEHLYVGRRPLKMPSYQWPPVVDAERFRPDAGAAAAARGRWGVPQNALFVGAIGNLVPMKGLEYFIRAAGLIHSRRPDSWFLISGSTYSDHDDYPTQLREEARASGVPKERFIWTEGPPEDCYRAIDMMLICSIPRSEGATTTAVESLACETPVVATDVGSVSEVVIDDATGTIVPSRDSDALADATLALADDPSRLARLGAEGRRQVIERHSPGLVTEAHIRAFEAALANTLP